MEARVTANNFWDDRKRAIQKELQDLRGQLSDLAPSVPDWDKLVENASRELVSEHGAFRRSLGWQVIKKAGIKFGFQATSIRSLFDEEMKGQSRFSILSYAGESSDGKCMVYRLPFDGASDPVYFPLKGPARRLGEAVLALDYKGKAGFMVSYRDGGYAQQQITYYHGHGKKQLFLGDVSEAAFKAANEKLQPILHQFGMLSAVQARITRLKEKIKAAETGLVMAEKCAEIWSKIYLPEDQLRDIFDSIAAFTGPNSAPGALLLKGVPGNGKTMCAVNIASSIGGKCYSEGINTLKKGNIGQSAEAVRDLWKKARENKPAVIFVDEADGVFAKRGSPGSDTMTNEITNAFLAEWNGKEPGIWVIACTNRREMLDDAILSRCSTEMEIRLPNEQARRAILTQELQAAGYRGSMPANIAALTQGMSGRDLEQLARNAARTPNGADFPSLIGAVRLAGNPNVDANATWETLVLDSATLANIKTTCAMLQDVEAWRQKGVIVSSGILLEGPPGTGKTQIARTIANQSGLAFLKASSADLRGLYQGHSGANVRDIFAKARAMSPAILFIDEIDVATPARDAQYDTFGKEIVGQILQEMDGISKQNSHVFVLAATNNSSAIDPAVLSRFTERLYIPLPDPNARFDLLRIMLGEAKASFCVQDVSVLVEHSEGLSGRDVKNWITKAQQRAVSRAVENGGASNYQLAVADMLATAGAARKISRN
jgi:SpoVK/Ycf46/Vps4 family AAA+-type ATPase